ncbi:MAG: recombinase RecT [Clostridia bacterium]|nr:recombinase RecT [Clostridia bacterium]
MANNIIQNQTAVAKAPEQKTMQQYIKSMEGEIKKALPSVITPERFTRMVLSALSVTPQLASCTPKSFLGAMMNAAQLGLEPNTPLGQAYLIPYKNKGVDEVQFQIGYKGLIDLAWRSGEISDIQAHVVYEKDLFECEYGLEPKLRHKPADSERGAPVKVYAIFKTKSGGFGFEVMSMDDVRNHAAKYSKAYGSSYSPWKTNFEEMAKKTVLKRVLKYAPLKSDFVRAVVQDESVKNEISSDMYEVKNDNVFETVDYTEIDTETGEVTE